ncbi:PolC-type DNA polymerase III [Paenibacillus sp. PDC88]|uniref:3'-5' exonuclease n=1 Tax=Paenibacillus sp. PDC88 TaxID=1884375 RepID=UPI00089D80F5|nr:3'-5' exonuclease [Paenibacillus sp. PDC88]SDW23857.1 ATP-dependent DNA helicase DinG/DNA polymerase-3 subunit alpha [Paenibacillus sp. PDC88]
MENEIVTVIDIETTGLDPQHDHITEIAAIRAEVGPGGYIREIGRFQTYVSLPPGVEIPEFITELTGIKAEDLRGAPHIASAKTSLRRFSLESTVVAHNAPFDLSFIPLPLFTLGFACTRAMSRLIDPDENASLAPSCERYGIQLNGHHRAMNDVEATLQLYAVLKEKAEVNGITYRNVVVDSPERPLTYTPPGAIVRTIMKTKEAV